MKLPHSFFIMHRHGEFQPGYYTENQCREEGVVLYWYECVMVFDAKVTLDDRDFICDHKEVDEEIRSVEKSGSCERMHLDIAAQLAEFFKRKKIPLVACRVTIYPSKPPGPAWQQFAWIKSPKHAHCFALTS